MRVLCGLVLFLALSGCSTMGAYLDTGLSAAEDVSEEVTARAVSLICNRISVRQWRESFARSRDALEGWLLLCGASQHPYPFPIPEVSIDGPTVTR